MLKLIFGATGSGKTEHLTSFIRKDIEQKKHCFLLVPEQQAYISERDLPALLPKNAGLYFEIVNFSGLAESVFRKYGGITRASMNTGMRSLLMWDTLRVLSPMLHRYGNTAVNDISLTSMMLQTVDELRMGGITGEELETAAKKLPADSVLQKKLFDIALIDATFHARVEEAFGADPSDRLMRMAKLLAEHRFFENTNLYIDSFTSFTAQEYTVLREILKQADLVCVTLLTDAPTSRLPHFESTVETGRRLQKLAAQVDTEVERVTLLLRPDKKPLAISALERDLWRFEVGRKARTPLTPTDRQAVRLVQCANLYEESEAAALHIAELIDMGMHYGDIAVTVRDIENYRGVLDAALERYQIPYFLSENTDLNAKPLSRLVLSALRAVARHYRVEDIITIIKTGLAGVGVADGSMFEEYCNTWHISGSRFTDEVWSMNPDGLTTEKSKRAEEILEAANRTRKKVMDPLLALATELRASTLMPDRCRALYNYLCRLQVSETLADRAREELMHGQHREAGETVRLYDFLTDTLSELCKLFPSTELSAEEFISVLTLLFTGSELGSVPNVNDCVMIGSAATLRVENIKASLVLGLCEGDFPRSVSDDGILTESDKVSLEGLGLILDSRTSIRSSEELLYVYRAMTKPCERLCLSTVSAKTDGSALTPSLAFTRASFLLEQEPLVFDMSATRELFENNAARVPAKVTSMLPMPKGTNLHLSQTRLQTFMLCPYRYFCTYRLHLREQKDSRPSYADDGLFLHYVFEHFLKKMLVNGAFRIPEESELQALADEILNAYLCEVCPIAPEDMDKRLLHIFTRLHKLALIMLRDILAELKHSLFVPFRFEQFIGAQKEEDGYPPVVLELQNGSRVTLSGVIDRVDLYEKNGVTYVRVVDYKSGVHQFSPEDVKSGLDIQLVLYLAAVLSSNTEHVKPAGAQYLYAKTEKGATTVARSGFLANDDTVLQAADTAEGAPYTKKLLKQTEREIYELIAEMQLATKTAAERILAGEAQKTPSEQACGFCPVRTHCDKAYHK